MGDRFDEQAHAVVRLYVCATPKTLTLAVAEALRRVDAEARADLTAQLTAAQARVAELTEALRSVLPFAERAPHAEDCRHGGKCCKCGREVVVLNAAVLVEPEFAALAATAPAAPAPPPPIAYCPACRCRLGHGCECTPDARETPTALAVVWTDGSKGRNSIADTAGWSLHVFCDGHGRWSAVCASDTDLVEIHKLPDMASAKSAAERHLREREEITRLREQLAHAEKVHAEQRKLIQFEVRNSRELTDRALNAEIRVAALEALRSAVVGTMVEIVRLDGEVSYRRPIGHPLVGEAIEHEHYTVRIVNEHGDIDRLRAALAATAPAAPAVVARGNGAVGRACPVCGTGHSETVDCGTWVDPLPPRTDPMCACGHHVDLHSKRRTPWRCIECDCVQYSPFAPASADDGARNGAGDGSG